MRRKVCVGQIWTHTHDRVHYLVIGHEERMTPWLVRSMVTGRQYWCGIEEPSDRGYGWLFVSGPECPECGSDQNVIPEGDYLCEECRAALQTRG